MDEEHDGGTGHKENQLLDGTVEKPKILNTIGQASAVEHLKHEGKRRVVNLETVWNFTRDILTLGLTIALIYLASHTDKTIQHADSTLTDIRGVIATTTDLQSSGQASSTNNLPAATESPPEPTIEGPNSAISGEVVSPEVSAAAPHLSEVQITKSTSTSNAGGTQDLKGPRDESQSPDIVWQLVLSAASSLIAGFLGLAILIFSGSHRTRGLVDQNRIANVFLNTTMIYLIASSLIANFFGGITLSQSVTMIGEQRVVWLLLGAGLQILSALISAFSPPSGSADR